MKKTILSGGAGVLFLDVAGEDDPIRLTLDNIVLTLHDDTTPIRNDWLRQPTTIKIGDRQATIRARITSLLDGKPLWELFGFESTSKDVARRRYKETLTIPSSAPYELTLTPESGYSVDYNAIVVIDYDGDTPTGDQYDRVSSVSQSGEYSVDEGTDTLTFHADDAGKKVIVEYLETKTGTVYAYGNSVRRCARLEASFPVFDEFGCPADLSKYLSVVVPRVVPTSDLTVEGSRDATSVELEFTALADPDGVSLYLSPIDEGV